MAKINPYLTFNGNCEEAFDFYKGVLGGEFLSVMRFKDAPPEMGVTDDDKEKIMHISLPIAEGSVLMGSDSASAHGDAKVGTNFSIAISPDSEDDAKKLFDALSAGGQVKMPLEKAFWGSLFGMFTDKFGIQWMVNYGEPQK